MCTQGLQWPHDNVFPIADILRSALTLSTCMVPCNVFTSHSNLPYFSHICLLAASIALLRKQYFGSKYMSFFEAAALAANAPDGKFVDNSRLTCLRCCNNLLCLRPFQIEVALQPQEFLAPLISSAAFLHEGIRSEWSLLLRNVAASLNSCRPSGFETQAQYIAVLAIPILRASSASSGEVSWNAALALGTCLHMCKNSSKQVEVSPTIANDSKAVLSHVKATFDSTHPAHLVALEALELLQG